jgi:hypothetical protein
VATAEVAIAVPSRDGPGPEPVRKDVLDFYQNGLLGRPRLAAGSTQRHPISAALDEDRGNCGRADRTPAACLLAGTAARG